MGADEVQPGFVGREDEAPGLVVVREGGDASAGGAGDEPHMGVEFVEDGGGELGGEVGVEDGCW